MPTRRLPLRHGTAGSRQPLRAAGHPGTDSAPRHVWRGNIYTDGRSHPKPEDLWPTPAGDSIGRWENGALVVDTIAHEPGPVAPFPGTANLSGQAHFIEHLRRIDADTLEDQMTIEDPQRLAHPWQVSIRYRV